MSCEKKFLRCSKWPGRVSCSSFMRQTHIYSVQLATKNDRSQWSLHFYINILAALNLDLQVVDGVPEPVCIQPALWDILNSQTLLDWIIFVIRTTCECRNVNVGVCTLSADDLAFASFRKASRAKFITIFSLFCLFIFRVDEIKLFGVNELISSVSWLKPLVAVRLF